MKVVSNARGYGKAAKEVFTNKETASGVLKTGGKILLNALVIGGLTQLATYITGTQRSKANNANEEIARASRKVRSYISDINEFYED